MPHDSIDFLERRFGIYILGAGFSCPAGLPVASELWPEIRRRARNYGGRAGSHFEEDLKSYIDFRRDSDGINLMPDEVQFEEFLAFLDVEHYLGLRGSDTWSSDGNETQVLVKTLIGTILAQRTPTRNKIPELYLNFVRMLKPPDIILTFNYDVLLERAFEAAGIQYRLFPDRFESVGPDSAIVNGAREEIVLLKMHGSIDWFDRTLYDQVEVSRLKLGLAPGHSHPVFAKVPELRVVRLTDGPRFPDDPLQHIYRVGDIDELYRNDPLFLATPVLLNPSPAKLVYTHTFRQFWEGLGGLGLFNFGLTIIGFSLPAQDEYLRQFIYRIVRNYQNRGLDEGDLKHTKTPLALVDLRTKDADKQELLDRYRFIDPQKSIVYFNGFNEEVLGILQRHSRGSC